MSIPSSLENGILARRYTNNADPHSCHLSLPILPQSCVCSTAFHSIRYVSVCLPAISFAIHRYLHILIFINSFFIFFSLRLNTFWSSHFFLRFSLYFKKLEYLLNSKAILKAVSMRKLLCTSSVAANDTRNAMYNEKRISASEIQFNSGSSFSYAKWRCEWVLAYLFYACLSNNSNNITGK